MKDNQTLKITRPSYVVAETSKIQKEILNTLADLGYSWSSKRKATEYIPMDEDERLNVIIIYPDNRVLTTATYHRLNLTENKRTELKIQDFKPKVVL